MKPLSGDLFTNLPASLSCTILSEWIWLRSLARLDSAQCNRSKRPVLVTLMRSAEFMSNDFLIADRSSMLAWVLLRDVKVTWLVCNHGFNQKLLTEYLHRNARHVRTLNLQASRAAVLECRNLLDLTCYFSQQTIQLLAQNPHLQSLNITQGLDNQCLKELDQLHLLNLRVIQVFLRDATCSECLLAILAATTELREFHLLSFNLAVDTQTWLSFAQYCGQLRVLTINYIHIQDEALSAFTRMCPHITTLSITDSDDITDEGVLALVQNLHNLRSLDLRGCEQLTDDSVVYIAQYCVGTLEELFIGNEMITEAAVVELQSKCMRLRICEWSNTLPADVDADDHSESD